MGDTLVHGKNLEMNLFPVLKEILNYAGIFTISTDDYEGFEMPIETYPK